MTYSCKDIGELLLKADHTMPTKAEAFTDACFEQPAEASTPDPWDEDAVDWTVYRPWAGPRWTEEELRNLHNIKKGA